MPTHIQFRQEIRYAHCIAHVNDQRLYYEDTGGTAPIIAFSHGMLMDHEMFAPQVEALRNHYRCITWDERAHGKTAGDTVEPFSYYDSANDLAALLGYLGVRRAILAGMSQGGFLTLRCALTHHKLVSALILIDTQAGIENPEQRLQYQQLFAVWAADGLPDEIANASEQVSLGAGCPDTEVWKQKWRGWQGHNLLAACDALVKRDDISDRLAEIDVPALVIHGDADMAIPIERGQDMAQRLPDSKMVTVPGAGHAPNLSHPQLVNAAIEDFLNRHVNE